MSELGNIDIKVFGLPDERHEFVRNTYRSTALELREKQLAELRQARLTEEQSVQAKQVEQATRQYFLAKMRRLGLPEESLLNLPEVHYTVRQGKQEKEMAGQYRSITNIVEVFAKDNMMTTDFFDKLSNIAHELSHALVSREVEYYFPEVTSSKLVSAYAGGLEFIDDHMTRGSGIEEGMVIFDQADFFHAHLKDMFPKDYQRRKSITNPDDSGRMRLIGSERLRKEYRREIDQSLYGSFNPDHVHPFVIFSAPNLPMFRKWQSPMISSPLVLKEYLFARKLCELVGRNASDPTDPMAIDVGEAVRIGREILDKDRYLRTGEAHRRIIETLGQEDANKIFQLGAYDDNIDDGMRILVTAQRFV